MKTQKQVVEVSRKSAAAGSALPMGQIGDTVTLRLTIPTANSVLKFLLGRKEEKVHTATVVASDPIIHPTAQPKRGRGRPKGSKNKNKTSLSVALMTAVASSPGSTLPELVSLLSSHSKQSVATTLFNLKRQGKIVAKGTRRSFTYKTAAKAKSEK